MSRAFDILLELQKLLGPEPITLDLPKSVQGIIDVLVQLRKNTVQIMAVRLKRDPPSPVSEEQFKQLAAFLATMHNLEVTDPRMKTQAQLDKGLELIFNPIYKFPIEYARVAKYIYDKFESEHWGADQVEVEDLGEEIPIAGGANGVASQVSENIEKGPLKYSDFPHESDPVYGINGIMHHILRIKGPKVIFYQIDPSWVPKNAKVFGHNGFKVGTCWPNRVALLRDGAHGQRMSGISGNIVEGAYSIVVSGMYDDLDKDEGHRIYYSGSNSIENTSYEPTTSNQTKALERSVTTGRPIRVFRTSQGKWRLSPRAGIRYDGLYVVVGMSLATNMKGGRYKRFSLDRLQDQDDILVNEPCQRLINLFNRVQDGYTRIRQ